MERKVKIRKCFNCGNKSMYEQNLKGNFLPFKDFDKVEIRYDFYIEKCSICGELSASGDELKKIDEQLEYTIASDIRKFIKTILGSISITQKEFASKIGLSEQYVSNLKKGVKFPSAQIFNFFKVLAETETALDVLGISRSKFYSEFKIQIPDLRIHMGAPVEISISRKEELRATPSKGYEVHKRRYMSIHDIKLMDIPNDLDDSEDLPQAV